MMSPRNIRTTLAQPEVRTCFAPHLGHASALVLISFPHSLHFVIATTHPLCVKYYCSPHRGLTPELSRAAKRRRLGRIVRSEVTAAAAEPQAATPRMTQEPLAEGRATRGPRLEEPKRERRPAEATNTCQRERKGTNRTTRRHPSANPKVNSHAWRRRTCAFRSEASETRSAAREPPTNADPAKRNKRRARCSGRSRQHRKAFPQA